MSFLKKNKLPLILAVLILLVAVYIQMNQGMEMQKLIEERKAYQAEIERLKLVKLNLQNELKNSGNLDYIEMIAREKLKMVKPDEIVYYVHE
ncbi:FtsB family cell division protein [Guggenheimella bovis]